MELPPTSAVASALHPAAAYLESLSSEARRLTGQVFTPPHLVKFILREARFRPSADGSLSLLDPSCGAGAFLVAASDAIAEHLASAGVDLTSRRGHIGLVEAVEQSLFGVDIDGQALELAREGLSDVVKRWTNIAPPATFFVQNLVHGDFLIDPDVRTLPPVRSGGFHFIIGNPPYVSTGRLIAEYKDQLR